MGEDSPHLPAANQLHSRLHYSATACRADGKFVQGRDNKSIPHIERGRAVFACDALDCSADNRLSFPWLRIPLVSSRDLPNVYEAITLRPLLNRR